MKIHLLVVLSLLGISSLRAGDNPPVVLLAKDAKLKGDVIYAPKNKNLGQWDGIGSSATWVVKGVSPDTYNVTITYALKGDSGGRSFKLSSSTSSTMVTELEGTGGWFDFKQKNVGTIKFTASQTTFTITAKEIPAKESLMNLTQVMLQKAE
jgi:hypothetical protein